MMMMMTVWYVWTNEEHHYQSLLQERMMCFEHRNLNDKEQIF